MITLEATHLTRFYGQHQVLHDISFTLEGAGVTGLLGRNGAGKSTLLRLLAAQDIPTRGEVRSGSVSTTSDPLTWRAMIGWLPEAPPLHGDETPTSMLAYHLGLHGIHGKQATTTIDEFISRCQLQDVRHQPISELSFGYRKRTGLAVALSHRPKIVLLDEPGAGLDPAQLITLRHTIADIASDHLVILSSHLLHEIAQLTPEVLVLHQGRLITHTTDALLDDPRSLCSLTIDPTHQRHVLTLIHTHGELLSSHTSSTHLTCHLLLEPEQRTTFVRALLDAKIEPLSWRVLQEHEDLEARFMNWTSTLEEE